MRRKTIVGLRIIGTLKLASAVLLAALGFGIFRLIGGDVGMMLEHYVRMLHLDPEKHVITTLIADASGVSERQLKALDIVTFLYALLYTIEGIGLLLARHWAEFLTIFATAALIPIEIYEIVLRISAMRIAILIINAVIVVYLILQLQRDQKTQQAKAAEA